MDAKKRDESLASEPANEATAAGRLQLSVKRMKRLRVAVKGGPVEADSLADRSW